MFLEVSSSSVTEKLLGRKSFSYFISYLNLISTLFFPIKKTWYGLNLIKRYAFTFCNRLEGSGGLESFILVCLYSSFAYQHFSLHHFPIHRFSGLDRLFSDLKASAVLRAIHLSIAMKSHKCDSRVNEKKTFSITIKLSKSFALNCLLLFRSRLLTAWFNYIDLSKRDGWTTKNSFNRPFSRVYL